MKTCKNCGKEIENGAVICVNCGVAVKQKKPIFKKWWFWLVIIIAVIAIATSGGGDSESKDSGNNDSVASNSEIVYEAVDLQTMLDDLSGNALKAEKTYMNKYVEVTGKITNFDSDGSYISIEPTNADEWNFDTVMCKIKNDAQEEFLMEKSVEDTVVIKGKITSVGEVLGFTINIDEIK